MSRKTGGSAEGTVFDVTRHGGAADWLAPGSSYINDALLGGFLHGEKEQTPDYGAIGRAKIRGQFRGAQSPAEVAALVNQYRSAASLEEQLGHLPAAARLRRIAEQYGGAGAGGTDYSTDDEFSLSQAGGLRGAVNLSSQGASRGKNISAAAFNAQVQQLLAEKQAANDQRFYNKQIDPSLSSGQEIAHGLATTPAYGYDAVAQMRSQSAAAIKGATEQRMLGLGSLFGMSGLSSGSPAMTAIGERAAREADDQLQRALSDITMRTTAANRSGAAEGAGLESQLAMTRLQARSGVQSGDRSMLYGAASNLSGVLSAEQQAREARQYQGEQERAAADAQRTANYIKYGTAAVGLVAAPFTGGASLALTAGALGGGAKKSAAASPYSGQGAGYTAPHPYGDPYSQPQYGGGVA